MTEPFELRRRTPAGQLRYLAEQVARTNGLDADDRIRLAAVQLGLEQLAKELDPPTAPTGPECPYDYHEMADEGITCVCQPHSVGDAYGCPEGCPTHNPSGEDVPEGAIGGPATDDDEAADRYADMVNAPLRPETIAAIANRIKAGDFPVRKVKPREQP